MNGSEMNKGIACLLVSVGVLGTAPTQAGSFDSVSSLTQQQFVQLAKNVSAATHYKSVSPAEPLGVLGLDVGIEVSSTEIDEQILDLASSGSFGSSQIIVPRLHAHKGLPFGLDVGASISSVPDTDISIIGGELRYSFLDGGALSPALALRASYSQLQGITEFDLNSSALELTVSKGVLLFTPYAGAGIVRTNANPNTGNSLSAETFEQDKLFVGVTINLGIAVTVEADQTGDYRSYTAKAGVRF